MELHRIADDLDGHGWYERLVERTVAEAEAFAGRWAAFQELVAALAEREPDERE